MTNSSTIIVPPHIRTARIDSTFFSLQASVSAVSESRNGDPAIDAFKALHEAYAKTRASPYRSILVVLYFVVGSCFALMLVLGASLETVIKESGIARPVGLLVFLAACIALGTLAAFYLGKEPPGVPVMRKYRGNFFIPINLELAPDLDRQTLVLKEYKSDVLGATLSILYEGSTGHALAAWTRW